MPDRIRIRSGGSESTFSAPGPVVLGRDPSVVAVVLDHGSVSRRHAQIAHGEDGWVLTDLGSSNGDEYQGPLKNNLPPGSGAQLVMPNGCKFKGTWIDGRRITGAHRVSSATSVHLGMEHEGADITIEPVAERVDVASGPATERFDLPVEPVLESVVMPPVPAAAAPSAPVPGPPDVPGGTDDRPDDTRLFGTGGAPVAGADLRAKLGATTVTFPAVPDRKYTVGRDPDSDLTTDEEIVSRTHLELAWNGEVWTATDVSARGTFTTKGTPLPKGLPTPLAVSTTLRLGGSASGEPLRVSVSRFPRIRRRSDRE